MKRYSSRFVRVFFFFLILTVIVYGIFDSYRAISITRDLNEIIEEKSIHSIESSESFSSICSELETIKKELIQIRKTLEKEEEE